MSTLRTIGLFDSDKPLHYVSEDLAIVDELVVFRKPGRPTSDTIKKAKRAVRMVDMHLAGELTKREDGLWQQRVVHHGQF